MKKITRNPNVFYELFDSLDNCKINQRIVNVVEDVSKWKPIIQRIHFYHQHQPLKNALLI